MSPKIPALPAGSPCAKHLYTIAVIPTVKLENVSPFEPANLAEDLGINNQFSLDFVEAKVGTGELAGRHAWYTMNYSGYLLDGTKFDSGTDFAFALGLHPPQVIRGWDSGLAGMRVGGKRRLFVPFQLGYGNQAHGPIPAGSMMVFDLELVSISDTQPKPKTPPTPPAPPATPSGTQPVPPANPATPSTVPPPADPTKPAAVPPKQ